MKGILMEPSIAKREHLPAQPCVFCGAHTSQFYRTVGITLEDCAAACNTCIDSVAAARAVVVAKAEEFKS